MAKLSEDARSVRPADGPTDAFTSSTDADLAASLSRRLSASEASSSDDAADSVPVDRNAPLTGVLQTWWHAQVTPDSCVAPLQ
jgi:hypothetical protein